VGSGKEFKAYKEGMRLGSRIKRLTEAERDGPHVNRVEVEVPERDRRAGSGDSKDYLHS